MKWHMAMALSVMICVAPQARAQADKKSTSTQSVEGRWQGALTAAPGIELRITLQVSRGKDGSLSGKWGSPDQGASNLPLASISCAAGTVTFDAKTAGASFKGKLNPAGTEIAGEWSQGGKNLPLTFKRVDASQIAPAPIPAELEGIWLGKLKVTAGIELRLALKVEKDKNGVLKALLASPDQGANNIPISSIGLKDGVLTFESKSIGARFTGKKNKEGTAFEGEFVQRGVKLPLVLAKTDKIKETVRPQTPKPPFPYRSEAVTYENASAGVKLAGTLSIPAGTGPFPAVILISGSGAQDRDETILGHKPFLVLADFLSRRGVAVLRVDDRGVGGSTGSSSASTSEDFAGDVLSGVALLKKRGEINPKKIGLIGHSEGGLIAPIAAARSKDVAFIVLMAGTGLPGTDVIKAQGELIAKVEGATEAEIERSREIQQRAIDIFLQEKDEKAARAMLAAATKEMLSALPDALKKTVEESGDFSEAMIDQFNNTWFRSFLVYDPRPTLKKVSCPVLAINGEKDLQVPPKENLAEIVKALQAGGNRDVKTIEFKGLNHLFQPCTTGSPSEYGKIETTIAPEVLKALADWIVEKTRAQDSN
jgi:uncharacterized protein